MLKASTGKCDQRISTLGLGLEAARGCNLSFKVTLKAAHYFGFPFILGQKITASPKWPIMSTFWPLFLAQIPPQHRPLLELEQYSGVLSRLLLTSSTVRLLVFLSTLGLETRLYVFIRLNARYTFVVFSLDSKWAGWAPGLCEWGACPCNWDSLFLCVLLE